MNIFSAIWNNKRLITTWARYNIEADYLETKLGAVWIALQPLMMTFVYSIVFTLLLNRQPRGGVPYVSFFLSGMILWTFFSNSLTQATNLIAAKANLISQTKFPADVLIFVAFAEKLVDFVVSSLILVALNFYFGFFPTLNYLYLLVLFLTFFFITLGAMLVLAPLGVFIQDISQFVSIALRFMFYFSGVLISRDMLPERVASYLDINPIFFIVESFRNVLLYNESPDIVLLVSWLLASTVILFLGFWFFKRFDGTFADYK
jgi:ABC-type polysaccharide/polyol phosphate export permease